MKNFINKVFNYRLLQAEYSPTTGIHSSIVILAMIFATNLLFPFTIIAQTVLTIQPTPAQGKDAEVFSCVPCGYDNSNFGTKKDFDAIAWTNSGNLSKVRSLMEFDLSSIPTNALVTDAKLSLFFNTTSGEGNHSGSNASYLQRIINPWTETTVTWNNQPATTTANQILLPACSSNTQNYLNIDIRTFIMDMVANPSANFGFMIKLVNETVSKKMILASSDHNTPSMRPLLVITYTAPLPVSWLYFNGKKQAGGNHLEWATSTEVNCSGFTVERSTVALELFEALDWVNGNGTSSQTTTYSYTDRTADYITGYYYRLRQVDYDGKMGYSNVIHIKGDIPDHKINIGPNPFKDFATIGYSLSNSKFVQIEIYTATGIKITNLKNELQQPGSYEIIFDPRRFRLKSGNYIFRITLDSEVYSEKLIFRE